MVSYFPILSLLLILFISVPFVFAQDPEDPNPDMVDCGPRLLPLASCAPFVQGSMHAPIQTCCDNLLDLYEQQPKCLCILLSNSTFTNFPINKTLALQLPIICNLNMNIATCPGLLSPPDSSQAQISKGTNEISPSNAVSPAASVPVSNMGFGLNNNASAKMKIDGQVVLALTVFLLLKIFCRL